MVYTATLYSGTHIHRQYLPSSKISRAVCECTTRDSHTIVVRIYRDTVYSRDKYARRIASQTHNDSERNSTSSSKSRKINRRSV